MKTYAKQCAEYSGEYEQLTVGRGQADEFSTRQCDCCGSYLGGSRTPGHGLIGTEWYELEFCSDCVQYIANGELPESATRLDDWRETGGKLRSHTNVGGYPIAYLCDDGGTLCPDCAEEEGSELEEDRNSGWYIETGFVHREGEPLVCDHCNGTVDSAYGGAE